MCWEFFLVLSFGVLLLVWVSLVQDTPVLLVVIFSLGKHLVSCVQLYLLSLHYMYM